MMVRPLLLVLAGSALFFPISTSAQKQEFVRPPYAGAYEPQGVDERGLWMEIDEFERRVQKAAIVMQSHELTQYVQSVLCKAVGDDRCASVRVYIIKDSSLNASMYPNGMMFVHTGLLARVHSEAELAAILGHEFGHFEKRHSLNDFRKRRTLTDISTWVAIAGSYARTPTADIRNNLVFSYYRFSRTQESEADMISVEYIRASPYRLRASGIWQRVIDEDTALRKERGLRKRRKKHAPNLLDSHPTHIQRIEFHAEKEAEAGNSGDDAIASYRAATAPYLKELFDPLIRDNDFGAADYVIRQRGAALGWDAQLYFLHAELFRMRGHPRDFVTARDLFQKSLDLPDSPAESWRGLGLCAMRMGEHDAGQHALTKYLELQPDATDRATVKLLLGT